MKSFFAARRCRIFAAGLLLMPAAGCDVLSPKKTPPLTFYSLDSARIESRAATPAPAASTSAAPTLIVNPPHAAAGFDSRRIIYLRTPHTLEYYAHSEWIDTPARMLAPLIVAAVEGKGAFRAVVLTPSAAAGDLRLDIELIRLQHDFSAKPSKVRFTLRAYFVDVKTRSVLAWREFDAAVPATSEDPYGGVVAANRAVQTVLEELSAFCAETALNRR